MKFIFAAIIVVNFVAFVAYAQQQPRQQVAIHPNTCSAQMDRIETLLKATLVGHDGATFGKPGWNALSAFRRLKREQPDYLNAGSLDD